MQAASTFKPVEALWRVRLHLFWRGLKGSWAMFAESKIGLTGLGIILFFALFGALWPAYPWLMEHIAWTPEELEAARNAPYGAISNINQVYHPVVGYDPLISGIENPSPPSRRHPLGTNQYGRDILAQLMASTGSEFMLGVLAALITVVIGTLIGAITAYYGGLVDTFFMRLADVFILFPLVSFLIVLGSMIELTLFKLAFVLGILYGFGQITVILKSQALAVKVKPYIEAAKVAGGGHFHVIFRHIIPNLLPLAFLYMMFNVTGAIFSEAALSFFGLLPGIKISWGIMIDAAHSDGYILGGRSFQNWWLWVPPGVAITLLCSAFYLVGRGLDEVVNPRLRKR
ncbi:MAG: ABC transporter permease [Candidatus Bipolaricaulia bacterium]